MKPCLIFDLDGTLVDSLPGIAASLNRALTGHGLTSHSDTAIRSFIGDGVHTLIRRAAPSAEPSLFESLLTSFKKDYTLTWNAGTLVYPGIRALLTSLQDSGFKLAILSNKPHDFTVEIVRAIFPDVSFAMVLGQRDGVPHKPDPTGAIQIATTCGTTPQNCIVIGDSTMDLETAANAGMKSIGVSWGYHDRARLLAVGASCIIDEPAELPAALD